MKKIYLDERNHDYADEITEYVIKSLQRLDYTVEDIEQAVDEAGPYLEDILRHLQLLDLNEILYMAWLGLDGKGGMIDGRQYHLWKNEEYVGIGTFIINSNYGFAFHRGEEFLIADRWELVDHVEY